MPDDTSPTPKWAKMVEAGKATRFKKGDKPWCFGKKGEYTTSRKGTKLPDWWVEKLRKPKSVTRPCSEEKKRKIGEAQRGQKHWAWQGNASLKDTHQRLRNTYLYKAWRKGVYERDGYTCTMCGKVSNGNLQADHYPIAFSVILRELETLYGMEAVYDMAMKFPKLWDIKNGRTLCVPCHKKTDTYGLKLVRTNAKQYV